MKIKNKHSLFVIIGFFFSIVTIAQENLGDEPTDDLGNVTDQFQEHFFEALKQKAIENNELALVALQKAEKAANENPTQIAVVNYEIGKNLAAVRRRKDAEAYFKKVLVSQGDRLDVMESLYDIYYQERDYNQAIPLVKRLIEKDEDYKEDLANLYSRSKQYDKALILLDELDESWGESVYRNNLRTNIYKLSGNKEAQIERIEAKGGTKPKNEQDYLNLIYLYSDEGNTEKAFETAKALLKNYPKNELAHLALYKFYLEKGETKKAISAMDVVFASQEVDKQSKYRVLGDFINFVNDNPSYEKKLENVVSSFSENNDGGVYEKLGDYYITKNKKEDALTFYEKGIKIDEDNYSLLKNTLLLQIEVKKFTEAAKLSDKGLSIFPSQPLLYLLNGVSNIGLSKPALAIERLEEGVDYLIDDATMERDFYKQLSEAYTLKGDAAKAAQYAKKAQNIVIE